MAFKLGDYIIDRIDMGWAEDFDGNILYVLTQLADGTITISSESTDAVDKTGTLIKRFFRAKTGEFTANNAMINAYILGEASGSGVEVASEDKAIDMPKLIEVGAGETVEIKNYVEGTVKVYALSNNGVMGKAYSLGAAASDTEFAISEAGVITPPTDANESRFIVRYQRSVTSGAVVRNKADKFPGTVKLYLKALGVEPCSIDTLRACYIELPSFQVSPDVEISLTTDAQMAYSGTLQVDYCSKDKSLYNVYWADEDEEE